MADLRLFFSLDLPARLKEALSRYQRTLPRSLFRPLKPENLHITLAFLGDTPEEEVPHLSRLLTDLPLPSRLVLTAGRPLALPSLSRISVLTLKVGNPGGGLEDLASSLREALLDTGHSFDPKPFKAHLTLAYLHRSLSPGEREEAREIILSLPPFRFGRFSPESITLMQSTLTPAGSIFTPLATRSFRGEP
ncbi:2'-5' RNA ligase [Spirochaeta thermophila DSM 6578]|uniref:RNA 2',3'-cyclic phosphodiesterase n=1 Tax=Winmispira thermophila (strain ATCC 700085 / DSM 6578 / Z-1203) TaxID=869211 RepID=G0GF37_WINT7|nr:RNA 2',3'-cyclic phosphodiesterase [Spirochaeta thermophila]AEJ62381.1 2'-5' RNA ligase [Spirochaeta thermophila DSM 6578]